MQSDTIQLVLASADSEAIALCLALGTLEAMRSGLWPLEAGVWTLGRPAFWKPLERVGVPDKVLAVFQSADELDALCKLGGRAEADLALDRMLNALRSRLAEIPEKSWSARWEGGERGAP